jgi:hypothetical protein
MNKYDDFHKHKHRTVPKDRLELLTALSVIMIIFLAINLSFTLVSATKIVDTERSVNEHAQFMNNYFNNENMCP